MTEDQFNVVAELIRSQEPVRSAAKKILLEGVRVTDAARDAGVSASSASNAARRIRLAYSKVCSASPWRKARADRVDEVLPGTGNSSI